MPKGSKLFQIGEQLIEARNMGEALGVKRALVAEGKLPAAAVVVEHEGLAKHGKVKVADEPAVALGKVTTAPAVAVMGNPMEALRNLGSAWDTAVVNPISQQLKSTLTPNIQVQGQDFSTASPVSDVILETAANPVNYVPGGAGAILGAADAVAHYAEGGLVEASDAVNDIKAEPGVPLYDISGPEPVLGEVPHDQFEAAVASGRFALPQGARIPVLSPEGEFGDVPSEQAAEALKAGFKYVTPQMEKEQKYGTGIEQLKTVAEGALDSATFGLSGAILNQIAKDAPGLVATPEERRARAEVNPMARVAGQVAGLFTPGGAGGLITKAGEAVAAKLAAKTVTGRVGSAAAQAAVENVIFSGGDEIAKAFMKDPNQSAESIMSNLGLSAVIGGGIGGLTKGTSELWAMGPGKKLTEVLNGLKAKSAGLTAEEARLAGLELPPEVIASMKPGFAKEQGIALQQSDTMAGRKFQRGLDDTYRQIEDQVNVTLGKTRQEVAALDDLSDFAAGTEIRKTLEQEIKTQYEPLRKAYKDIEEQLIKTPVSAEAKAKIATDVTSLITTEGLEKAANTAPGMLRMAQGVLKDLTKQETAQDLRILAQNIRNSAPYGSENYQLGKKLIGVVKKAQDDATAAAAEKLGANTAANFKQTQAAYREFKTQLDDLNAYLRVGRSEGAESFSQNLRNKLDGADVIKRLSKDNVELRQLLDAKFPAVAQKAREYELNELLRVSRTKSGDAVDLTKLSKKLANMDPESRAQLLGPKTEQLSRLQDLVNRLPKNDNYSGTAKALDRSWGSLPAAAGGLAGMLGAGGMGGALLGLVTGAMGKEMPAAARLATLKFLATEAPVSAKGFKAAVDAAKSAYKAEKTLDKAAEAVFAGGKTGVEVSKEAIEKLKGQVDAVSAQPELLMNVAGDVGHYMSDQAAAMSMAAARNVRYLASLRPQTAPMSPLDAPRKVSADQEQDYNRALAIAENPLIVLDDIKDGRINAKDMQHLAQLAPAMQAKMRQKLTEQMIAHLEQGKPVPYKTQIGLSLFMGQPLSSSLQPQAIMAAQPKPAAAPGTQLKGLGKQAPKMPAMYQTPQQTRAAQRAGRK